jgi:hypothetical protein
MLVAPNLQYLLNPTAGRTTPAIADIQLVVGGNARRIVASAIVPEARPVDAKRLPTLRYLGSLLVPADRLSAARCREVMLID